MTTPDELTRLAEIADWLANMAAGYAGRGLPMKAAKVNGYAAILRGMAGQQWQPIETAPKYTTVRLYSEGFVNQDFNPDGSIEGQWMDDRGWVGAMWNGEHDCWDTNEVVPTHWMPLPAAPIPKTQEPTK